MWFNGTQFGLYDWLAGCQHWVEVRHSPGHVIRGQRLVCIIPDEVLFSVVLGVGK